MKDSSGQPSSTTHNVESLDDIAVLGFVSQTEGQEGDEDHVIALALERVHETEAFTIDFVDARKGLPVDELVGEEEGRKDDHVAGEKNDRHDFIEGTEGLFQHGGDAQAAHGGTQYDVHYRQRC